jgi:MFS family permease
MMYGRLTVNPIHAAWNTVARFDDYESAQRAVDRLSDNGYPVEHLDIVGTDLQLVERVTGRLTKWRAAAAGGISGMWAGLLIGVLFALFTTGHGWLAVVAVGIGLGVLWGAIFGFAAHLATPRRARLQLSARAVGGPLRPDRPRRRGRTGPHRARPGRAAAGRIPLTTGARRQ